MDEEIISADAAENLPTDDWDSIDLSDIDMSQFSDSGDLRQPPEPENSNQNSDTPAQTDGESPPKSADPPAEEDDSDLPEDETVFPPSSPNPEETFSLNVLGQTRTVNREEVIRLAQKGADYDRVKGKNADYEEFLRELAAFQGVSPQRVIDNTRAEILSKKNGISHDLALERVQLDRERKEFNEARNQHNPPAPDEAQLRRDREIQDFLAEFGQVDPKTIPESVWQDVRRGTPLLTAYLRQENKLLRRQLQIERQNEANHARSTGSQSTAGKTETMSEWERLWYAGN